MNAGGIIVVLIGSILVVIGLRGTQSNVFPWFFNNNSSNSNNGPGPNGAHFTPGYN